MLEKKKIILFKIILTAFLFFLSFNISFAADLTLGILKQIYNQGEVFPVTIYLNSTDQAVNAIKVNINFDTEKLEILSLSKTGSLINLWVSEPVFSNESGIVNMEGLIFNPGFQGRMGKLLTLNFKAKNSGEAAIDFGSSSVLANDGLGTEVLKSTSGVKIFINKTTVLKETTKTETTTLKEPTKTKTTKTSSFLELKEMPRKDLTEPQVTFQLKAFDGKKYLNHFEIKIDNSDFKVWIDDGSHLYKTEILPPGKHKILARALTDTQGFLVNNLEFEIKPLPSPAFTFYPDIIYEDQPLVLKGKTDPTYSVSIYLMKEDTSPLVYELKPDANGDYSLQLEKGSLKAAFYTLWQEVKDSRGAKSLPSEKISLTVKPHPLLRLGSIVINSLALSVVLAALIFLVIFLINYLGLRIVLSKKFSKRQIIKKDKVPEAKIKKLIEELDIQIKKLENISFRRTLTDEEIFALQSLRKQKEELEEIIMPWRSGYKF